MTGGQLPLPFAAGRPHLRLARQLPAGERHRKPTPRSHETIYADRPAHAHKLRASLDKLRAIHAKRTPALGIAPEAVVVLRCNRLPEESSLRAAGLQVLDRYPDRLVVAAGDDAELAAFRLRLQRYEDSGSVDTDDDPEAVVEPDGLPKNANYKNLFDCIDEVSTYGLSESLSDELQSAAASGDAHGWQSVDIECWCPEDDSDARRRNQLVRAAVIQAGGLVRDHTVRTVSGLSLVRATIHMAKLQEIASLDHVRRVDALPQPKLSYPDVARSGGKPLPLTIQPRNDAPIVALIDSGIRGGHPLLAPAVAFEGHSTSLPDATDEYGHGTFVASLILHGSLEDRLDERSLQPDARLVSIRVLDEGGGFPETSLWESDLLAALEVAYEQGARVVNISIGDSRRPYTPPRPTPLAAAIDEFVRRTDLVVVISAGNMLPSDYSAAVGPNEYLEDLLTSPTSGLLDPATSALSLTVGGVGSDVGQGYEVAKARIDIVPVSRPNWPSPVSRVGPGAAGMIKPDLVAPAGGYGYDEGMNRFVADSTVQVVGANFAPPDRPLAANAGTSFAAPLVSHAAARVLATNPQLTGRAIRALMLASTRTTEPVHPEPKKEVGRIAQQRLTGYGRPEASRAAFSGDHRVALLAEQEIPTDGVHLYRVEIPGSFFDKGGWRELVVTLAFNPMTRATRLDYLASRMAVTAYKGVDLDEVASAYINFEPDALEPGNAEQSVDEVADDGGVDTFSPAALAAYRLKLQPATTTRSRGANQLGRIRFSQRLDGEGGLDLIIAVRHINVWGAPDEQHRYALAVALERDDNHAPIYDDLLATVEQVVEVRAELEL